MPCSPVSWGCQERLSRRLWASSPHTSAGRSILFFARCAPSLAWCCWLWWHPGRPSMSKSNLWRRATWAIVFLVVTALSGTGRTEPPPATVSAEGGAQRVAAFTASARHQFNGAPSLSAAAKFVSIVLGAAGGLSEDNLTSYLLAPVADTRFIALDAGTLLSGIKVAIDRGSFADIHVPPESSMTLAGWILRQDVKAYALSHAHLHHISGLILNSPDDSQKPILGLAATLDALRDHVFNWQLWPNFGNEGREPQLQKYVYRRLLPAQEYAIPDTSLTIQPFPLSHAGSVSTAFLIQAAGFYVLYCGDTGPDAVEHTDNLHTLWSPIAPLVRSGQLRAIFLEASYTAERPDHLLFGHLTPTWLLRELGHLAQLVQPQQAQEALHGLTVVVTHIKPELTSSPSS